MISDLPIRAAVSRILDRRDLLGASGSALPLYLALLESSNEHGLALQTRTRLAERLGASKEAIGTSLQILIESGLVVRHGTSPFLVLRLVPWSGVAPISESIHPEIAAPKQSHISVPVNSSAVAIAVDESSGDRGPGEGALLEELEAVLGPFAAHDLRAMLRVHPVARITAALERVRRTPEHQIKKTRLAFFRYLLSLPRP